MKKLITMKSFRYPVKTMKSFRYPVKNKEYYETILKLFCLEITMGDKEVSYIEVGKQDTRGSTALTFCKPDHTVKKQIYFDNNKQLLQYCLGYVDAKR